MHKQFAHAYFHRDKLQLTQMELPVSLKQAVFEHWKGEYIKAIEHYEKTLVEYPYLDRDLQSFIVVEIIFLQMKRGASPQFSRARPKTFDARSLLEYTRFCWFFYVDHKKAFLALLKLLIFSPFSQCRGLFWCSVFLVAHLAVTRGHHMLAFPLARVLYSTKFASRNKRICVFAQDLPIACFTYALLLSRHFSAYVGQVVETAEHLLPEDPFYHSLFQASALYLYGYTGDISNAEVYAEKMRRLYSASQLIRYRPISKIMVLLPYAMRGYGYLIRERFEALLANHKPENFNQLINSQFYRAGSVIALYLGKSDLTLDLGTKAVFERKKTKSFQAWNSFDKLIQQLASGKRIFDPQRETLLGTIRGMNTLPSLGGLIIELLDLMSNAIERGTEWFHGEITHAVCRHLETDQIRISTEYDSKAYREPLLKVGNKYIYFKNIPDHRLSTFRDWLSSLYPIIANVLRIYEQQVLAQELQKAKTFEQVATRVAHDIRSPLLALKVGVKDLGNIPKDSRLLIDNALERILEISQHLITKKFESLQQCQVVPLIESLIREKTAEFRNRQRLIIDFKTSLESLNLFICVQISEFTRILSNIINNAAEAIDSKNVGNIVVGISAEGSKSTKILKITISDNGRGIPTEHLAKLGQPGFSYGKTGGSGIGLYHAKTFIEKWGGTIFIDSQASGTQVTLSIPVSSMLAESQKEEPSYENPVHDLTV